GRSGGGPHALACAALLPGRVTRTAVLVSLAPQEAEGLDWFAGMAASNIAEFTAASAGFESLSARLIPGAEEIRADPASLLARLLLELPYPDQRVVADAGIRMLLTATYAEALRTSAYGWIDDALALRANWGFDIETINTPVLLWHG